MKEVRINWNEVRKRMVDKNNITFVRLSEETGISKNTLSKKNMNFKPDTVNRLAHFFECSPFDLLHIVDAPPTAPAKRRKGE